MKPRRSDDTSKFSLFAVFLIIISTACQGATSPSGVDEQATIVALALTQTAMVKEVAIQAQIHERATLDALRRAPPSPLWMHRRNSYPEYIHCCCQVTQQAALDATSTTFQKKASQQTATAEANLQATAQVNRSMTSFKNCRETA